jgi:hypothetical protein
LSNDSANLAETESIWTFPSSETTSNQNPIIGLRTEDFQKTFCKFRVKRKSALGFAPTLSRLLKFVPLTQGGKRIVDRLCWNGEVAHQ